MAVRIRMKKMGRRHRAFFRICAMDSRSPRDGKVIEELGHYDPMIKDTDARAVLKGERIDYWLGVGAEPSDKVKVLIKKYGTKGTHLAQQQAALEKLNTQKPTAPAPVAIPLPTAEEPEAVAEETATEEPAAEAATSEQAPAAETPAEAPAEKKTEESSE